MIDSKYQVWIILNPPNSPIRIKVTNMNEVMRTFEALAAIGNDKTMKDAMFANCSGLEVWDNEAEDFEEWYDANGEDVEFYWQKFQDCSTIFTQSFEQLEKEGYNANK